MDRKLLSVIAASAIVGVGCSSSSGNNPPDPVPPSAPDVPSANIRLLHASPDSPAVNIAGLGINNLDYKEGSGATRSAGEYTGISVDGILPDGSTATVFEFDPVTFEADTLYTIVAIDDPATDLAVQPVILAEPATAVPAGNTRLQVVHGAPDVGEVSVFLTAPGAALDAPVVTFSFGGTTDMPVDVPSTGPYQIRITAGGEVAFDSGELAALPDGANLVITAVENTNSADGIEMGVDSPVSLVALTSSGATVEFQDVNSPAELRAVHASADTPAVDIIVNDDFMNPAVTNLSYPNFAPEDGFLNVPGATYDISVVPTGTMNEAIDVDGLEIEAGVAYDVLAINELANVDALLAVDDFRRVETAAKVRIIHASTLANTVSPDGVDIYVTEPGSVIDDSVDPAIENFAYAANTGFIQLFPGDYTVTVTAAGSKEAAIGPVDVGLVASGIYTFIARDPRPDVMDDPLGLIILDDAPEPVL